MGALLPKEALTDGPCLRMCQLCPCTLSHQVYLFIHADSTGSPSSLPGLQENQREPLPTKFDIELPSTRQCHGSYRCNTKLEELEED